MNPFAQPLPKSAGHLPVAGLNLHGFVGSASAQLAVNPPPPGRGVLETTRQFSLTPFAGGEKVDLECAVGD